MDKLLSGLALAAVSGLTFIAYKHPEGYERIVKPLRFILPVLFVAAIIWDISASKAFLRVYDFIDPSKLEAAKKAVHEEDLLNSYIVVGYVATMLYIEFLAWLPAILGEPKPPNK